MIAFSSLSPVSWAAKPRTEILDTAGRDGSVVVIPIGSVEQHGHHLPVATDTLLADAVATAAAERVANDHPILVTPPIWSGYSPHHRSLGGTLTLELEMLLNVLEEVADAALDNGFDGVCFVNGHGGNASLVDDAVGLVGRSHRNVEAVGLTYFELTADVVDEVRESDIGGMAHGGEFETSLMLHLHEELVRMDDAEAAYLDEPYERGMNDLVDDGPLSTYRPFEEYSASGAIGDPALASAETGAELFEDVTDELAVVLRNVSEQSRAADLPSDDED